MRNGKQPRALYVCFFVQMWEAFSYYGMRALLVLYMISQLGFTDLKAYGIYALYCALSELGGIAGGYLADRFLGLRRTILMGGWIMALGHLGMAFEAWSSAFFYMGLTLIIVGSCLFSTNISALLSTFYEKEDPRREKGYTLFYAGLNLGALLASLLCGWIGETYGWHYGFGLATIGMLIGNSILSYFKETLQEKEPVPPTLKGTLLSYGAIAVAMGVTLLCIHLERYVAFALPFLCLGAMGWMGRKMIQSKAFSLQQLSVLGLTLLALAIFYSAEEQIGSSLVVLSERFALREFMGSEIPNAFLLALNPLTIVVGGFLLSRFSTGSDVRGMVLRMGCGILMACLAFCGFVALCAFSGGALPMGGLMGGVAFLSIAEVLIGPAIYAYCSAIAPANWRGMTMGLIPLGFSLAEIVGGVWSKMMAFDPTEGALSLSLYQSGFGVIALGLFVVGCVVLFSRLLLKREARG